MRRTRRRRRFNDRILVIGFIVLTVAFAAIGSIRAWFLGTDAVTFTCASAEVLDGDTFDCGAQRVRLAGIDAPELPGHCRPGRDCTPGDPYASTANLRNLIGSTKLECRQTDTDVFGRAISRCTAGERDLSCEQLAAGQAVRRYGWIWC